MKEKDLLGYIKYINETNAYNSRYGFDLFVTIIILGGLNSALAIGFFLFLRFLVTL